MTRTQVTPPFDWSNTPVGVEPVPATKSGAATETTLAQVRDRLPSTPLSQAVTDAQLRASAVPVIQSDQTASGTISTQNLSAAGGATANSSVELALDGGTCAVSVQTVGTYTGALSLQGTINGTVWVTVGGVVFFNVNTGAASATIASAAQGIFQAECSGYAKIRISALAAVTGSVVVSLRASRTTSVVALDAPIPAGSAVLGAVTQSGTWTVGVSAPTAYSLNSAATTNLATIKASAGTLYGGAITNVSGSVRYFKLYNKASNPTLASDVPVLVIPLAASSLTMIPAGTLGIRFGTGIAAAITGAVADTDATTVGAGEVKVFLAYV